MEDRLDQHVVGVRDTREQVVLDLVVQTAREVVPEPRAGGPVHARLALHEGPVVGHRVRVENGFLKPTRKRS